MVPAYHLFFFSPKVLCENAHRPSWLVRAPRRRRILSARTDDLEEYHPSERDGIWLDPPSVPKSFLLALSHINIFAMVGRKTWIDTFGATAFEGITWPSASCSPAPHPLADSLWKWQRRQHSDWPPLLNPQLLSPSFLCRHSFSSAGVL